MHARLAHEVGLLRTIVRNLERMPIPIDPRALALWRAQGIELTPGVQTWKTTIRLAGHDAFNELSECLVALVPSRSAPGEGARRNSAHVRNALAPHAR